MHGPGSTPGACCAPARPGVVHDRDTPTGLLGGGRIHSFHTAYYCYWRVLFFRSFKQQAWG